MIAHPDLVRVDVVTSLLAGEDEFRAEIVPLFADAGLPVPRYIADIDDALSLIQASPGVPATIISTPNAHHFAQIEAALLSSCHVYVERPACLPGDDLPHLVALADRTHRLFFIGTQRRLEGAYAILNKTLQDPDFGSISSVRCFLASGQRPSGWRLRSHLAGGGIILDTGYHLLDTVTWLLAMTPGTHPFALVDRGYMWTKTDTELVGFHDIETTALGVLLFHSGVVLSLDLSYAAPEGSVSERIEFRNAAGTTLRLDRTEAARTGAPGRLTYQRSDGAVNMIEIDDERVSLWSAEVATRAAPEQPLLDFLSLAAVEQLGPLGAGHPCSGGAALQTWNLLQAIYELCDLSLSEEPRF